ncbi:hypothetical protein GCM10027057_29820 [Marisediminicola antarctica]
MARLAEHHGVALGLAAERVRSGVVRAEVRFDLGEPHRDITVPDHRAQQQWGDLHGRAREQGAIERVPAGSCAL